MFIVEEMIACCLADLMFLVSRIHRRHITFDSCNMCEIQQNPLCKDAHDFIPLSEKRESPCLSSLFTHFTHEI